MILKNVFSPMSFWKGNQHSVLDIFSGSSCKKTITLDVWAVVTYVAIIDNANIDFAVDICWSSTHLDFYGIFVGDVKSQVVTSLLSNNSFAHVHLFCVVKDGVNMEIDGAVHIDKDIVGAEGHLTQEQFLLGTPKHLLVRPVLDVYSHQIKASHWAKIHTLDQQKLFYMMSKWLSLEQAQKTVVQAWLQAIFDRLSMDQSDKQVVLDNILQNLFTSSKSIW